MYYVGPVILIHVVKANEGVIKHVKINSVVLNHFPVLNLKFWFDKIEVDPFLGGGGQGEGLEKLAGLTADS